MTKEISKAYDKYDRAGAVTPKIQTAETEFDKVFSQIKTLDADLAMELDRVIGTLARAYEQQGFMAGYNAASR